MHGIQPVVHIIGRSATDGLAGSSTRAVVGKAGRQAGTTDRRQLIPGVPRVSGCPTGICHHGQIAVEIVGFSAGAERGLLVVRVVVGARQSRWEIGSGECAAGTYPMTGSVTGHMLLYTIIDRVGMR